MQERKIQLMHFLEKNQINIDLELFQNKRSEFEIWNRTKIIMAQKFKLMRIIEWINIDTDKDSMIDLPPKMHRGNRGLETHIRVSKLYMTFQKLFTKRHFAHND